jgi:AbrB family looped-hinge helix DNA binding protein
MERILMNADATVTSKGQTTIPKKIRDSLQMKAGDRLTFTLMPDGLVLMRVKNRHILDVAGKLHKPGRKARPIEQLSR